jgi:DNA-binding MarR family transcriptional regulator
LNTTSNKSMGLVEKNLILSQISPPFDPLLSRQLFDEFISIEQRYIQGDWEPAELDGGQFCEILARILYHLDSGNLNQSKSLDDCCQYIENQQVTHSINPRNDALLLVRVLRTVYKFRSQRGAVHISPTYTPNQMDSKFMIESVRWCMNETLRIFWQGDREKVAKIIRELLQFDVPCIGKFEDILLVQRTDLTAEEEILVLLHYAGEIGFSRSELGRYTHFSPSSVTRALQKLSSPQFRQIVMLSHERYRLTDLGSKRLREELADKLLLQ